MESGESPLEVLSRAATIVKDSLPKTDDPKQSSTKQLPTTKWKRDRRARLPDYSRKSDPKLPENLPPELKPSSPDSKRYLERSLSCDSYSSNSDEHKVSGEQKVDGPLDMSVKQRGLPPSYSQAISNLDYKSSSFRPSVITQAATTQDSKFNGRSDLPSGISMCDPIIDEHFRRSLGKDYAVLFSNNNVTSNAKTNSQQANIKTLTDIMDADVASLSVDDHFAKALGDTWVKLNNKEKDDEMNIENTDNSGQRKVVSI